MFIGTPCIIVEKPLKNGLDDIFFNSFNISEDLGQTIDLGPNLIKSDK